jgi:hypothetical protein
MNLPRYSFLEPARCRHMRTSARRIIGGHTIPFMHRRVTEDLLVKEKVPLSPVRRDKIRGGPLSFRNICYCNPLSKLELPPYLSNCKICDRRTYSGSINASKGSHRQQITALKDTRSVKDSCQAIVSSDAGFFNNKNKWKHSIFYKKSQTVRSCTKSKLHDVLLRQKPNRNKACPTGPKSFIHPQVRIDDLDKIFDRFLTGEDFELHLPRLTRERIGVLVSPSIERRIFTSKHYALRNKGSLYGSDVLDIFDSYLLTPSFPKQKTYNFVQSITQVVALTKPVPIDKSYFGQFSTIPLEEYDLAKNTPHQGKVMLYQSCPRLVGRPTSMLSPSYIKKHIKRSTIYSNGTDLRTSKKDTFDAFFSDGALQSTPSPSPRTRLVKSGNLQNEKLLLSPEVYHPQVLLSPGSKHKKIYLSFDISSNPTVPLAVDLQHHSLSRGSSEVPYTKGISLHLPNSTERDDFCFYMLKSSRVTIRSTKLFEITNPKITLREEFKQQVLFFQSKHGGSLHHQFTFFNQVAESFLKSDERHDVAV